MPQGTQVLIEKILKRYGAYQGIKDKQQEADLVFRAQSGDTKSMQQMIAANMGLVLNIANKLYKSSRERFDSLDVEDLISEGVFGLKRAIELHKPSKSAFSTYAYFWIQRFMILAIYNQDKVVKIPVFLHNSKNRDRSSREVLDAYGRAKNIIRYDRKVLFSNNSEAIFSDFIKDEKCSLEDDLFNDMAVDEKLQFAMDSLLSDTEKKIIHLHFYEKMPLTKVYVILGFKNRRYCERALNACKNKIRNFLLSDEDLNYILGHLKPDAITRHLQNIA